MRLESESPVDSDLIIARGGALTLAHATVARTDRLFDIGVCLVLLVVTCAAYVRTVHFPFVDYDDNMYVFTNPHLSLGFTPRGVWWALTTTYFSYWHPVTWLTYLATSSAFGVTPGPMHAVNFILHAVNACLMYVTVRALTGGRWVSAITAAVWAWHPLRVESVAWVAETKDVLAGLFWLLTIIAYIRYARRPTATGYALTLACLLAGLASKPTVITLPCVLVLLDFWPLRRVRREALLRLALEKAPMFLLAAGTAVMAVVAQRMNDAMGLSGIIPLPLRLNNAAVSTATYVAKTIWPTNLAVFYPHPFRSLVPIPPATIAVSAAALVAIFAVGVWQWKRYPAVLIGYLWFLIALGPTIGLVQAGEQARADRYTYLPGMGLTLSLVCACGAVLGWLTRTDRKRLAVAVAGAAFTAVAVGLVTKTTIMVGYWKDTETLFRHDEAVTGGNYFAECAIAQCRRLAGDPAGGLRYAEMARDRNPALGEPYQEIAAAYKEMGRNKEALAAYREVLARQTADARLRNDIGGLLVAMNHDVEALAQFKEALRLDPNYGWAHHNIAVILAGRGDFKAAIEHWQAAVALVPRYAPAQGGLATALSRQGDRAGAIHAYRAAVASADAQEVREAWLADLGWLLATAPSASPADVSDAARFGAKAVAMAPDDPLAFDALAAARARGGDFDAAISAATTAADLATAAGKDKLAKSIQTRIMLYRQGRPYVVGGETAAGG